MILPSSQWRILTSRLEAGKSAKPKAILSLAPNGEEIDGITISTPEPQQPLHEVENLAVATILRYCSRSAPTDFAP